MNDSSSSHRKLSVILAADAAGYARLMSGDEAGTISALNEARAVFRQHIDRHRGRVIDTAGDSVLAEFPSPIEAVSAAVEIQQELAKHGGTMPPERQMQFRIGINLGDVVDDKGTIYGDGVNVAARLQVLADPGGICISGTVFDQVEGKLPITFKSVGEQSVKNIAKPVRVYRLSAVAPSARAAPVRMRRAVIGALALAALVGLAVWQLQRPSEKTQAQSIASTPPLPSGPSIAVLPFQNLSTDPAQEYFADGLAEDILTRLSRFSEIKVIGRNSTFRYKGKASDVRDVGRDLGANYVLEGSVRRTAKDIRVTVQLLETAKGTHLWAEDYTLPVSAGNILELQDSVANRVAATLGDASGVISRAQFPAVAAKPPESMSTYECLLKARSYNDVFTAEAHLPARTCLEAVAEREPNNTEALAWLSIVYVDEYTGPYNPRPDKYDPISKAMKTAEKAALLEPSSQMARFALANAHFYAHNVDKFVTEGRAAVALNPNNVTVAGSVGVYMVFAGYDAEGVQYLDRAVALNAYHPNWYHFAYFHYLYRKRDYEGALEALHRIHLPDWVFTQAFFTAIFARIGREADMKSAALELKRLKPGYSIETLEHDSNIWNMPKAIVRDLSDDLRKAGIPEKS